METATFIYLDIAVSITVLQTTTTASTAVGDGKIMIATAINSTSEALFTVFGGVGGINIPGSSIEANSITANEITANTLTASQIAAGTITTTQISGTAGITGSQIAS